MTGLALTFALAAAAAILWLPRRWAPLPLLAGVCYMTLAQKIDVGPFTFTILRILVAVGVLRTALRGEGFVGRWNRLDTVVAVWGGWAIVSSAFHDEFPSCLVTHLGVVYNVWGIYYLFRAFCTSPDDVVRLTKTVSLILVPVALEMMYEQAAFRNLFSMFGGVPDVPQYRDGRIRAFGPFGHPILAGTVGGVMLPMMVGLWWYHRRAAIIGTIVCVTMVVASASSGPAMSALVGVGVVALWPFRDYARAFRWSLVAGYFSLMLVMERPPYYIIQRLEVVGGSTGWYRARLIETSIEHFSEWWLAGTDVTRHWMFGNANEINPNHIDITNHYLAIGVMGGLPLVALHIAVLMLAFSQVGRLVAERSERSIQERRMAWAVGASLVSHVLTGVSVSYFDQSFMFLYLTVAASGSMVAFRHGRPMPIASNGTDVRQRAPVHDRRRWIRSLPGRGHGVKHRARPHAVPAVTSRQS